MHSVPGSVVGIATGYGLDGPGIESRWVEIFRTCPDRPWGPPSLLYNGYWVFPGGKERPGRDADPHPLLVLCSRKSRAIPLLYGQYGLYKGVLYLYLLHSVTARGLFFCPPDSQCFLIHRAKRAIQTSSARFSSAFWSREWRNIKKNANNVTC